MNLSILYRGPLSSCNYGCDYCPFAKRQETAAQLAIDEKALTRFVSWVSSRSGDRISILFTPWGEALIRRWYQRAFVELSHLPHVKKIAIQTNLSCRLDWIEDCNKSRIALWTTFHPSEITRKRFVAQCHKLDQRGVRYSVGVVGLKEHASEIDELRRELAPNVYLWINAYKRVPDYYTPELIKRFTSIDPLFPVNNTRHPSAGLECHAGESVISVDGEGVIRRCHFIRDPIGNIYEPGFEKVLLPRTCPQPSCGCHIGYVHMNKLNLYDVFGDGVLERVPEDWQTLRQ
ncbi:STM4011 family radical SAM protein [Pedosphaera parvula]|uniref:Radical SAM domain-containing protein n=1 Tax=Pedosphaera parvula (strain Ellin514) TaxID=320771 RepID=B9XL15_PEDPL|nr:STM4011 family radical SAM protein [Pedosphaera parvula]EEF59509.1 radical SAM domain-containing protein [Pedosphaera parvula Ellin514]